MLNKFTLIFVVLFLALCANPASAGEGSHADHEKTIVVKLKTDDFEAIETDVSDLAVGESEIIHTEDGRTIDLLRTTDGVEIYVDGELVDTDLEGDGQVHKKHIVVHKDIDVETNVEIECDEAEECEELVWISEDEIDVHSADHDEKIIVIKKRIEKTE